MDKLNQNYPVRLYDEIIETMNGIHESEMKLVKVQAEKREIESLFEILRLQEQFKKDTEKAQGLTNQFKHLINAFVKSKEETELREGSIKEREQKNIELEDFLIQASKVLDIPLSRTHFEEVPTFKEFYENSYFDGKENEEDHKRHLDNYVDVFLKIVGNKKLSDYTRTDIIQYIRVLERFPFNYGSSPNLKNSPPQELIEFAVRENTRTLSEATLKKHKSYVKGVFIKALEEHSYASEQQINKMFAKIKFSKFVPPKNPRQPWSVKQLNDLFKTPIWTGTGSAEQTKRHVKGKKIIKDAYWWLPIVALYTGCRLEEIAQLEHDDLRYTENKNYPFILVHDEGDRRVKTANSIRKVPIHKDLVELGFINLFKKTKKGKIFDTLRPGGSPRKYGHYFSKNFSRYRQECGVYEKLRDFHSLRKTFITEMRMSAKVDILTVAAICGHDDDLPQILSSIQTESYTVYGIEHLCEAVTKLDLRGLGLEIEHLYKKS